MDEIIQSLLNKTSYIYGGYIRDYIINKEEYKDIDILITEKRSIFERKLKKYYKIEIVDDFEDLVNYRLEGKNKNEILHLDVLYHDRFQDCADFDVNLLILREGILQLRTNIENINISSIIDNIKKKQFTILYNFWADDCDSLLLDRINKMKKRGWIPLNERYSSISSHKNFRKRI